MFSTHKRDRLYGILRLKVDLNIANSIYSAAKFQKRTQLIRFLIILFYPYLNSYCTVLTFSACCVVYIVYFLSAYRAVIFAISREIMSASCACRSINGLLKHQRPVWPAIIYEWNTIIKFHSLPSWLNWGLVYLKSFWELIEVS